MTHFSVNQTRQITRSTIPQKQKITKVGICSRETKLYKEGSQINKRARKRISHAEGYRELQRNRASKRSKERKNR